MKTTVRSLIKSFRYALRGLALTISGERNMRIHLVMAAYLLFFSLFYRFSCVEYAILLIAFTLVFVSEIINTAIETLVNLQTSSYNHLARNAKDISAGAVLICAVFAVLIGICLFWNPDVLLHILRFVFLDLWHLLVFLLTLVLSLIFIFIGPKKLRTYFRFKHGGN
ncbi:diacylglycerol kinase family protein [Candidatus Soleaferrea massiliensis]|uniref:diacylglycerol kinase family protein n=1 Tax=Candidatus Soleaferrea massiliensis TaxID=1470354 RepID=UPI000591498A|nr:diacylglycerol kinase family protein [Candidatus Soleaferrea massiliensis]